MPLWNDTLVPIIKSGKKLIIAAHGNTLRALVKHLDDIPEVAKALTAVASSETHRFSGIRCARAPPALRCGQHADAEWVGAAQDVIANLNIPTSVPLVYELDDDLRPIKHAQARPPPSSPLSPSPPHATINRGPAHNRRALCHATADGRAGPARETLPIDGWGMLWCVCGGRAGAVVCAYVGAVPG